MRSENLLLWLALCLEAITLAELHSSEASELLRTRASTSKIALPGQARWE
jgi:hypothetical protein